MDSKQEFEVGKIWDYHVHSNVSFDGQVSIHDMCKEGQKRGLSGITFTEHWELSWSNSQITFDVPEYRAAIAAARAAFPDFEIGMGIELGLDSKSSDDAQKASELGWDFIIGSCHNIDGVDVNGGNYCKGKEKEECFRGYLINLTRIIKSSPYFDVVGHLDLPRRDASFEDRSLYYADYADEIDALFKLIIPMGIGIELNTGGWRYGLDGAQPHMSVLKRYREMGGEIITCGTDCHTFKSIASYMPDGYEVLRQAGFKYISLFKERKPYQHKL